MLPVKNPLTNYADVLTFDSLEAFQPNYLKIFHVNIRSLNKNHDNLLGLLHSLKVQFDVIVLSELWIFNLDLFNDSLPGYNLYYSINSLNQSSGIGIYISSLLTHEIASNLKIDGTEYLQLKIKLPCKKKMLKFTIYCLYRHPGVLQSNFLNDLEAHIRSCDSASGSN